MKLPRLAVAVLLPFLVVGVLYLVMLLMRPVLSDWQPEDLDSTIHIEVQATDGSQVAADLIFSHLTFSPERSRFLDGRPISEDEAREISRVALAQSVAAEKSPDGPAPRERSLAALQAVGLFALWDPALVADLRAATEIPDLSDAATRAIIAVGPDAILYLGDLPGSETGREIRVAIRQRIDERQTHVLDVARTTMEELATALTWALVVILIAWLATVQDVKPRMLDFVMADGSICIAFSLLLLGITIYVWQLLNVLMTQILFMDTWTAAIAKMEMNNYPSPLNPLYETWGGGIIEVLPIAVLAVMWWMCAAVSHVRWRSASRWQLWGAIVSTLITIAFSLKIGIQLDVLHTLVCPTSTCVRCVVMWIGILLGSSVYFWTMRRASCPKEAAPAPCLSELLPSRRTRGMTKR